MANVSNQATSIAKKLLLEKSQSQINNSQGKLDKLHARVTTLTQQQNSFIVFLADDLTNKNDAQASLDFVNTLISGIEETMKKMDKVIDHTCKSNGTIKKVSSEISGLIHQLIYAIEVIDSLSQTINKSKEANELIPDDLVAALSTASSEANNAITLCLTAVESCNVTMTTSDQSKKITQLEFQQSIQLYCLLTGNELLSETVTAKGSSTLKEAYTTLSGSFTNDGPGTKEGSLYDLLSKAAKKASSNYESTSIAKKKIDRELIKVTAALSSEQVELASLKASLAAANAAALAA